MNRKEEYKGTLYMIATPIGNLEDITHRALKVLSGVHLVAAEDTRHSRKLLQAHHIQTPLTSLHNFNEEQKSTYLISRLDEGLDIAYISDAGTPCISDPGYELVTKAIEHNIRIVPVPGASSLTAALSVSGFPLEKFIFHGFLPAKAGKRQKMLETMKNEEGTLVFFESPQRLQATLRDMFAILGNRKALVARELTKIHEEVLRGTIGEIQACLQGKGIKGEVTLIVSGAENSSTPLLSEERLREKIKELMHQEGNLNRKKISSLADELGVSTQHLYRLYVKLRTIT